jgi:TonB family C-terminal domain
LVASTLINLKEPIVPAFVMALALHVLVILTFGFGIDINPAQREALAVTVALLPSTTAPVDARHIAAMDQVGELTASAQMATQLQLQTSLSLSRELVPDDGGTANPRQNSPSAEQIIAQALAAMSDAGNTADSIAGTVAARRALDAAYLARWRARVEQVGNALYRGEPPAGNGDVRLLVSVLADGTLERIHVLQSSGNTALDRAAQDTVVLAAPFPAFSRDLAARTGRLDIVRTWQFRSTPMPQAGGE